MLMLYYLNIEMMIDHMKFKLKIDTVLFAYELMGFPTSLSSRCLGSAERPSYIRIAFQLTSMIDFGRVIYFCVSHS